jgi:manganese efflux pump family protein
VAPVFGAITALTAFVGMQLGRAAASVIRIRSDLVTGVTLVVMATVMGPHL